VDWRGGGGVGKKGYQNSYKIQYTSKSKTITSRGSVINDGQEGCDEMGGG